MNILLYIYKTLTEHDSGTPKINERYKTKTINHFCLLTLFIAVTLGVIFFILQYDQAFRVTIFSTCSFLTVLLLNYRKYFISAKILLVFCTNASIVAVTYLVGYHSGFHLYLYTAPVLLFWLFDLEKEKIYIVISIFAYFATYIISLFCKYDTTPITVYTNNNFELNVYDLNSIGAVLILFVLFRNYASYFSTLQKELF